MKIASKNYVVLFTLILIVSIPILSYAVDGQRKLTQPVPPSTFPIVINQAGSYVLTSNLVVTDPNLNAIEITVNDVTLDLNGHKIQGADTGAGSGSGIYAYSRFSITIKNGRIWGFGQKGIDLTSEHLSANQRGAGHIIKDIQALNNKTVGILVEAGLIINCTANNNGKLNWVTYGICAVNSAIVNCVVNNNQDIGIWAENSTIENCTINYNKSKGIECFNSIITNCLLYNNEGSGIMSHRNCHIEGNNLTQNSAGISLLGNGNYVIKNVATEHSSGGFIDYDPPNYMPVTIHNPPASECSGNDNCDFPSPAP